MSITVNTNMSSLICQRSLTKATSGMNTALQRMSTGLKINSAKDDAAGCAISSKMDYKLSSYSVAQDNAQMGQSMIDTASGSVSVMTNMLQRMRDLSEQAANGTYGTEERAAMQAEVDALTDEIYRIKNTTDFNGKKILGEETKSDYYVKPDLSMADIDVINITQAEWDSKYKGSVIGISTAEELQKIATLINTSDIYTSGTTFALTNDIDLSSIDNFEAIGTLSGKKFIGTFDGNGYTISNLTINKPTETHQGLFGSTIGATIQNVNMENVNVTGKNQSGGLVGYSYSSTITNCSVSGTVTGGDRTGGLAGYNNYSTIKNSWCSVAVIGTSSSTGGFVGGNNATSNILNCSYDKAASGLAAVGDNTGTIAPDPLPDVKTNPLTNPNKIINKVNLQVGINDDENSVINVNTGFEIGNFKIALTTEDSARKALDKIDTLMAKLNAKSLDYGATSNRLASTMEFQSVQMSALTSANSLIKDADIAKESASYIKNQILQQTTATLLATANQNPSIALSLV